MLASIRFPTFARRVWRLPPLASITFCPAGRTKGPRLIGAFTLKIFTLYSPRAPVLLLLPTSNNVDFIDGTSSALWNSSRVPSEPVSMLAGRCVFPIPKHDRNSIALK
jgi:hypothetical protein